MTRTLRSVGLNKYVVAAVFAFFLFPASEVFAQQALLDSRAFIVIDTVKQTTDRKILVCDFTGPKELSALGVQLADDFSDSVARAGAPSIQVIDRSRLLPLLHSVKLEREAVPSEIEGEIAAEHLGADDFVSGDISVEGDEITLHIELHRTGIVKPAKQLEASMNLAPDMKTLLGTEIHDTPQSNYPMAGDNGYSFPRCIFCPDAQYTNEAVKKQELGSVVLMVVVGAGGNPIDVQPLKPLPFGLTESALNAVQKWRFAPAADPAGTPTTVRVVITCTFRLY